MLGEYSGVGLVLTATNFPQVGPKQMSINEHGVLFVNVNINALLCYDVFRSPPVVLSVQNY